ncbi:MAG: glycosyltransferase family 2 protein [Acidobacteria bacterium]|nr:MAG: glycosyltransferase family 2 protein [Acidobacteriota bacterium]
MTHPCPDGPLVSVVIPTFNRADMVGDAIDSVLAQTWPRVECIVVDDGSTDGTAAVLERYRGRIVAIRQENRGLAAARNAGLRLARGELVGFLDSDDAWLPTLVERVVDAFRREPALGAVFVAEQEIDERGRPLGIVHRKRTPGPRFTPEGMIGRDTGVGCGRPPVVRRELFARLGAFDESLGNAAVDCALWIPWSFEVPMCAIDEPLVLRRVHGEHVSGDQAKDARAWLRILDRVERDRPSFARRHRRLLRRVRAKHHLRIGRETLARCRANPGGLSEARRHLLRALALRPTCARAWTYLAWSVVSPGTYGTFRAAENRRRERRGAPLSPVPVVGTGRSPLS